MVHNVVGKTFHTWIVGGCRCRPFFMNVQHVTMLFVLQNMLRSPKLDNIHQHTTESGPAFAQKVVHTCSHNPLQKSPKCINAECIGCVCAALLGYMGRHRKRQPSWCHRATKKETPIEVKPKDGPLHNEQNRSKQHVPHVAAKNKPMSKLLISNQC